MNKTKIGIIGGGQLGKMLMEAGIKWNLHFNVLDSNPINESIVHRLANTRIEGSLQDPNAIQKLANISDVLTIEIENINVKALRKLEKKGKTIIPRSSVLETIQDKGAQKDFFKRHGIPTTKYFDQENIHCNDKEPDSNFLKDDLVVIKKRIGGYDGKGVFITKLSDFKWDPKQTYIIEEYIPNAREFSVIVVRDTHYNIRTYKSSEMFFNKEHTLDYQESPSNVTEYQEEKLQDIAIHAVAPFDSPGIFAVEMLMSEKGGVYVNEISPRPHNSGHHTIESCVTSQYEQLLRILLELPLGYTNFLYNHSLLFNLLGPVDYVGDYTLQLNQTEGMYIHLYGKKPSKPYRKLGHVNMVTNLTRTYLKSWHDIVRKKTVIVPLSNNDISIQPIVGVIMGSLSDAPIMNEAIEILKELNIPYEIHIISAHRTPDRMYEYAKTAQNKGIQVIIAGAGGAAHLPGMTASLTNLPVIGVPIKTSTLSGIDSLYSIVQMPPGIPVATMAINGAKNAALLAAEIISLNNTQYSQSLQTFKNNLADLVQNMEKAITNEFNCSEFTI